MSTFLQNNLFTIIIFLLLIILVLIGIIGLVLVKLLIQPKEKINPTSMQSVLPPQPEMLPERARVAPIKKHSEEPVVEKFFCHNHPDEQSIGGCLICEEVFCENCLVEHDGLYFCKEHFKIFANNKWKQITDVKTTPDTPTEGLYIYNFKRKIWREKSMPSFVITHYKINIEQDFIESFVQLNVLENEAGKLEEEIRKFQAGN